jgi:NADH dehydrogenase (ubiquinone) Fe-S protein 4
MGWTSTGDPFENVGRAALSFDTAQAAASFCEAHGWAYSIRPPSVASTARPRRYQQYGDNFSVRRFGIPEGGLVSESGLAEAAGLGGGEGGGKAAGPAKKAAAAKKKGSA